MILLRSVAELKAWRAELDSSPSGGTHAGLNGLRVGFVPTMGALHEGHAECLRLQRKSCTQLVLSIFVNPTQFGPNEDLSRYPRPLEDDLNLARACGVDAVFLPDAAEIYPPGYSTFIEETELSQPLCGPFRPGHFRGVTTIVFRLFNWVRPHEAAFGLKDAQQFLVIQRMVHDLDLGIRLIGVPTVREADGLALSSRNRYLSPEERALAPLLYRTLCDSQSLEAKRRTLESAGFRVQYLEYLELTEHLADRPRVRILATASYLGTTRLIDNVWLEGQPASS